MRTKLQIGIALSRRENAKTIFQSVKPLLEKNGHTLITAKNLDLEQLLQNKEFLSSDLILVFGGDGSILKTCQAIQTKTPIAGIGCGERNFLAAIPGPDAAKGIQELLEGNYSQQIKTRLTDSQDALTALNEILITPERSATLMHYEVWVDGERIGQDTADGLLVATPTGSSAYNQAAGGPRLLEKSSSLVITPLHSIENCKSLVVSDTSAIEIKKIHCFGSELELVWDGQKRKKLQEDEIRIQKSPHASVFAEPNPTRRPPSDAILANASPSSRFVWNLILQNGAMTQIELAKATNLHPRTIRRAIAELLYQKKISQKPLAKDQRQNLYHST